MEVLNVVNKLKNMKNSKSIKSNTGYKGIYFDRERGKFKAQVIHTSNEKKITRVFYVGLYDTLNEAKKQREDFIKNLF